MGRTSKDSYPKLFSTKMRAATALRQRHTRGTPVVPLSPPALHSSPPLPVASASASGIRTIGSRRRAHSTVSGWTVLATPRATVVRAYVAYPERKDKAPAMIIVHEIFGMTDWDTDLIADRYAAQRLRRHRAGSPVVAISVDRFGSRPRDPAGKRPSRLTSHRA